METLPQKGIIASYWRSKLGKMGILVDWDIPSYWACGYNWNERYRSWGNSPLERTHIIPKSLGGSNNVCNIFLLCKRCHLEAPDTTVPEMFFLWVRNRPAYFELEMNEIREALNNSGYLA